ncbi:MAG TPA: hypothetical protein ENK48_02900 [Gammaproteobacteria bacterium]|nr:hypothetical protein [Gammaproteobacteria bacterium]
MTVSSCAHFTSMPRSLRLLYSATLVVLGVGYIFATIYVFASHAGHDGKPGLSVQDLIIAYSGSKKDTRLESALKGPMAGMLPTEEKNEILAWVRRGASEDEFRQSIAPIIERRCLGCHNGTNPHIPNLSTYDRVMEMVDLDTGMDIFTLVRVSHIHLFGITFIFFISGYIFCHARVRPAWFKCLVIAVPFLSILCDIASWYLTKVYPAFAWVVMISGVVMALCFAIQWLVSVYQMWFYRLPEGESGNDVVT